MTASLCETEVHIRPFTKMAPSVLLFGCLDDLSRLHIGRLVRVECGEELSERDDRVAAKPRLGNVIVPATAAAEILRSNTLLFCVACAPSIAESCPLGTQALIL